jgi:hypothetical protein
MATQTSPTGQKRANKMNKASEKITMKINGEDVDYVRSDTVQEPNPKQLDGMDYCIIRSRDQGVICGYVESVNGRSVRVHQARQMYRWDSTFVLIDMANKGPRNAADCKFSEPSELPIDMLEACGVIRCTERAADGLIGIKAVAND